MSTTAVMQGARVGDDVSGGATIAIVTFPGARLLDIAVPMEVFGADRGPDGSPVHRVSVTGGDDGGSEAGGALLGPEAGEDVLADADLVIVPWWCPETCSVPESLIRRLRAAHARGATIAGSCLGVFVLAEAGLLSGGRATTHWMHTEELARRYPDVRVEPEALFVDEGSVLTAAGNMAAVDLCLHLLRRLRGATVAGAVARRMLVPAPRAGAESQLIDVPLPDDAPDDRLPRALRWALEHLNTPIDVDQWAATAYMSPRTFARRFRAEVGRTPHQWLLHQRVLLAQQLLESTDLPIDRITESTGFGSPMALRTHFRRTLGCSPTDYRAAFRGGRPMGGPAHGEGPVRTAG